MFSENFGVFFLLQPARVVLLLVWVVLLARARVVLADLLSAVCFVDILSLCLALFLHETRRSTSGLHPNIFFG